MQTLADMTGVGVKNRKKYADVLCGRPLGNFNRHGPHWYNCHSEVPPQSQSFIQTSRKKNHEDYFCQSYLHIRGHSMTTWTKWGRWYLAKCPRLSTLGRWQSIKCPRGRKPTKMRFFFDKIENKSVFEFWMKTSHYQYCFLSNPWHWAVRGKIIEFVSFWKIYWGPFLQIFGTYYFSYNWGAGPVHSSKGFFHCI